MILTKFLLSFQIVTIIMLMSNYVCCQRHSLFSTQRIGISTSSNNYDNYNAKNELSSDYDLGTLWGYQYKLIKKTNTSLYLKTEFARTRHTFPFSELMYNSEMYTENLKIITNRKSLHLGVRQQFSFKDDKIQIGLGVGVVKRFYKDEYKVHAKHVDVVQENSAEFDILFTTYHDGRYTPAGFISYTPMFNLEFETFFRYRVNQTVNIEINIAYSRNHYIYYDDVSRYYRHDSGVIFKYENSGYVGANNSKLYSRDHYLYFGVGIGIDIDNILNSKAKSN